MAEHIGNVLKPLWERDLRGIEKQTDRLAERYRCARDQVQRVAALMGMSATDLVGLCVETVRNRKDMTWLDLLDLLDLFYINKQRRDKEKAEEEKGENYAEMQDHRSQRQTRGV